MEKIDKTGEKRTNNFGSEMIITEYRKYSDIDIYFPEYDWIIKNQKYGNFKLGNLKCPYERRTFGVGYLGEGKYKTSENKKHTRVYDTWVNMLNRCYNKEFHKRRPTYTNCEAYNDWLCFQEFGKWDEDNYYKIEGETMCLDKDILVKHNKIYSPDTCIYVPQIINVLFERSNKSRGNLPIGLAPRGNKYEVSCSIYDFEKRKRKTMHLGYYDTKEKAFQVYKQYKESHIRKVADYYKNKIPQKLYDAMYNYQVSIND